MGNWLSKTRKQIENILFLDKGSIEQKTEVTDRYGYRYQYKSNWDGSVTVYQLSDKYGYGEGTGYETFGDEPKWDSGTKFSFEDWNSFAGKLEKTQVTNLISHKLGKPRKENVDKFKKEWTEGFFKGDEGDEYSNLTALLDKAKEGTDKEDVYKLARHVLKSQGWDLTDAENVDKIRDFVDRFQLHPDLYGLDKITSGERKEAMKFADTSYTGEGLGTKIREEEVGIQKTRGLTRGGGGDFSLADYIGTQTTPAANETYASKMGTYKKEKAKTLASFIISDIQGET